MTVVVDASAAVELLLRTPAAAAVEQAVVHSHAFAPELLDVEVASALRRLERAGELSERSAAARLRVLIDSPVERVAHSPLLPDAWRLRAALSLYDALYVALARLLRATLITADRRLASVPRLGVAITVVAH